MEMLARAPPGAVPNSGNAAWVVRWDAVRVGTSSIEGRDDVVTKNANLGFGTSEPEGGDLPPFVDAELKQRIADEGQSFLVVGVREAETAYGTAWMLDVELDGERRTLPLARTAHRDAQFPRLRECIDRDGPVP